MTVFTDHNHRIERRAEEVYRTEVLPLTSLTPSGSLPDKLLLIA